MKLNAVLTELTTRSNCSQLLSVVLLYLLMRQIPHAVVELIHQCGGKKEHFVAANSRSSRMPQVPNLHLHVETQLLICNNSFLIQFYA